MNSKPQATLEETISAALKVDFPTCDSRRFRVITSRVAEAVKPLLDKPKDDLEKLEAAVDDARNPEPIPELFSDNEKNRTIGALKDTIRRLDGMARDLEDSRIRKDPMIPINKLRKSSGLGEVKSLAGGLHVYCDTCGISASYGGHNNHKCNWGRCSVGTFQSPSEFV